MAINFRPIDDDSQPTNKPVGLNLRPVEEPVSVNTAQPENQSLNPLVSTGAAIVGGLSTGGAAVGESVIDAGTWLLNKLGAIDPSTKKQIDTYVGQAADTFKVKANPKGDIFERATAEHPYLSMGAELGVEVPTVMKSMLPKISNVATEAPMLAKLGSAVMNNLSQSVANATVAAGMAEEGKQDQAAKFAMYMTPVFNGVGNVIGKMANKGLLGSYLKDIVSPIQKELANNNMIDIKEKAAQSIANTVNSVEPIRQQIWKSIKEIPGTIDASPVNNKINFLLQKTGGVQQGGQINVGQVVSKVDKEKVKFMKQILPYNLADDYKQEILDLSTKTLQPNPGTIQQGGQWNLSNSRLEKSQQEVLLGALDSINNLQTMDDAINLKHSLSDAFDLFKTKKGMSSPLAADLFKSITKDVDNAIESKVKSVGLQETYNLAKKFHKQVTMPLNSIGAFKISKAFENRAVDPVAFNKMTTSIFTSMNPEKMKGLLNAMDEEGGKIVSQRFILDKLEPVLTAPETFNKNEILKQINKFIYNYKPVLKNNIKPIVGLKKLLEDSGAVAGGVVQKPGGPNWTGILAGSGVGSAVGYGTTGDPIGGAIGGALGGAAGGKFGSAISSKLASLLNSPIGIKILTGIAEGKPWSKQVKQGLLEGSAKSYSNLTDKQDE